MQVYENLIAHGYQLPESLTPAGLYVPVNRVGNLVFISGQGSIFKGENLTGRVGVDITLEQGQEAAKVCMLNTLGALDTFLGDLNRAKKAVKILGFVACDHTFTQQAQVINSASQVLLDAFGENGRHARSAIGTNALPLGLSVEIESIFEVE